MIWRGFLSHQYHRDVLRGNRVYVRFYPLNTSNDTDGFREGHDCTYDRGTDLELVMEETGRRLKQLYRDNCAAAYYRETVAVA